MITLALIFGFFMGTFIGGQLLGEWLKSIKDN